MRQLIAIFILLGQPLIAAPNVVASIPPLAGFVADLTKNSATPETLLPSNAEPHGFTLRPSQIIALREASIVFAVGLRMEPWLERVDGDFTAVNLGEAISAPLPARSFDLTPRAERDPHLWLDPAETALWVLEISQRLIEVDPEQAATYRTNTLAALAVLRDAEEKLDLVGERLNAADIRIVVTHDAFQYLERRLGVPQLGMLTDFLDARTGARSLAKISRLEGPVCIISNPEVSAPESLLPNAPRVVIDPMAAAIAGAPDFTERFYDGIANALETCFDQP